MNDENAMIRIGRRAFLQQGALILSSTAASGSLWAKESSSSVSVGLVTDLHYADKPPKGTRHYRETLEKLAEAAVEFKKAKVAFVAELGDFIDAANSVEQELAYLKRINGEFSAICDDRHYVLGNHCVDTLTKAEFLAGVEREKSYYSFDRGEFHFVVLDSCFRSDGQPYGRKNFTWTDANVAVDELEWLKADLQATQKKTIVFAHQRLDVSDSHGVKNQVQVREILQQSGQVLAVFQGHSHKNDLKEIGGIHYCTLVAMVEGSGKQNNGYAIMQIESDGTIRVNGFRRQSSYHWPA